MRGSTTLLAGALLLAACAPPPPALLWSHDPETYFSGDDFAAGVVSRSIVLLARTADGARTSWLAALDPETGGERWTRRGAAWVLHPPGEAAPLFVGVDGEPGELREIDPATGRDLRSVPVAKHVLSRGSRLVFAGGRIVYLAAAGAGPPRDVLGAIDPATGATLWEVPADLDRRFTPLALPDRILFPGSTYVAYAIADGRELSRTAGVCCTAIASPDGAHVYLRTGVDEAGELLGDGRIGRRFRGEVAAVSGRFVAVLSRPGASTLAVYAHGGARPLWSVTGKDEHDDFSAVGISGDRVLFFRSGDDGVWMHDLATGRDRALLTIHAKIVLSPDRRGSAPANMTTPPVLAPPLLFVHDWTIRAYRVEE